MMNATTVHTWQNLGFSKLQQTLDEQSTKLYETQGEGVASRKTLASQTKAFKKLSDEEKLGEVRSLLKNYQNEIDSLTNRCKFAEQCFMNVYKSLALLPDPAPLLLAQESEIHQLRSDRQQVEPNDEDSRLARELERQTLKVSQLQKQLRLKDQQLKEQHTKPLEISKTQTQSDGSVSALDSLGKGPTEVDQSQQVEVLELELFENKLKLSQTQQALKDQTSLANKLQGEVQHLSHDLKAKEDYDQIKQELISLKSQKEPASHSTESNEYTNVENRRRLRNLESQNLQLTEERDSLRQELEQLRQDARKLEDTLSSVQVSETFSTVSGWTAVPRGGGSVAGASITGASGDAGGSAISGIIIQQRDRYKKRMLELEEKLHSTEPELEQLKKDLENMKRERFTLYDRVRQLNASSHATANSDSRVENVISPLYDTPLEQKLKELDLDRRCVGLSKWQAKLVEISARALVDRKFRLFGTAYIVAVHLLMILGVVL